MSTPTPTPRTEEAVRRHRLLGCGPLDSVGAEFLAGMARHKREHDTKQAAWHAELRRQGVVATHPDDGWIDRVNNKLHFCYPHIMGEVKTGALVALGDHDKHRIVRLLSYREWITALKSGDGTWSFANTSFAVRGAIDAAMKEGAK